MDKMKVKDIDGTYDVLEVKDEKTKEIMERNASEMLHGERVFLYPYIIAKDYAENGKYTVQYKVMTLTDLKVKSFVMQLKGRAEYVATIQKNPNRRSIAWSIMNPRTAVSE